MPTRGHFSKVNVYRVLRAIQISDEISRKKIADTLGLDKSTLTKIVSSLLHTGIVREYQKNVKPADPRNVGRRPICLELNPHYGLIAGLEVDSDRAAACIIDLHGTILDHIQIETSVTHREIVPVAVSLYRELMSRLSGAHIGLPVLGVGLALPGIIDAENGIMLYSHPLAVTEPYPVAKELEKTLSVPVLLENNANCGCWGELYSRKERDDEDLVFIFVDNRKRDVPGLAPMGLAIGLGIAVDGRVRYGKNHLAGVFRSAFLKPGDPSQFHTQDIEGRLRELGANIAVIVNTLAPEHVVMYGEMSDPDSIAIIKEEILSRWPFPVDIPSDIIPSVLPQPGLAYGAAAMFMETLFSMPRIPNVGESFEYVYRGKNLLFI